jgi:hypothetical protein
MDRQDIPRVTASQIAFGKKLGLDLEGDTVGVAWARVSDLLKRDFWGQDDLGSPTDKQVGLAEKFGIGISSLSRAVADAIIDDIMTQLNLDAIRQQNLAPGVKVRKIYDSIPHEYVISSIYENGTVYFKGGNGQRAWARNVKRVV